MLDDTNIDEQRILTEAAVFAEKIAIDEEIVRLKSHMKQFRELLKQMNLLEENLIFLFRKLTEKLILSVLRHRISKLQSVL